MVYGCKGAKSSRAAGAEQTRGNRNALLAFSHTPDKNLTVVISCASLGSNP